ncbi:hypothetical protein ACFL27_11680, partial [candidate division CSSED10-310 bacterium]
KLSTIEEMERTLFRIDKRLTKALVQSLQDHEIETIRTECRRAFAKYEKNIGPQRLEKILSSLIEERIKTRYGLKSLSVPFNDLSRAY